MALDAATMGADLQAAGTDPAKLAAFHKRVVEAYPDATQRDAEIGKAVDQAQAAGAAPEVLAQLNQFRQASKDAGEDSAKFAQDIARRRAAAPPPAENTNQQGGKDFSQLAAQFEQMGPIGQLFKMLLSLFNPDFAKSMQQDGPENSRSSNRLESLSEQTTENESGEEAPAEEAPEGEEDDQDAGFDANVEAEKERQVTLAAKGAPIVMIPTGKTGGMFYADGQPVPVEGPVGVVREPGNKYTVITPDVNNPSEMVIARGVSPQDVAGLFESPSTDPYLKQIAGLSEPRPQTQPAAAQRQTAAFDYNVA